jgi:hypothetical protein
MSAFITKKVLVIFNCLFQESRTLRWCRESWDDIIFDLVASTQVSFETSEDHIYRKREQAIIITTSSTAMAQKQELWRSKLGNDYLKEYMEKNERRLYAELQDIRDLPGNRLCADCGDRGTIWASVNLGVFLCMTW